MLNPPPPEQKLGCGLRRTVKNKRFEKPSRGLNIPPGEPDGSTPPQTYREELAND